MPQPLGRNGGHGIHLRLASLAVIASAGSDAGPSANVNGLITSSKVEKTMQ